jgi:hypothetical protein
MKIYNISLNNSSNFIELIKIDQVALTKLSHGYNYEFLPSITDL